MSIQTFQEIRLQFPTEFLVLLDPQEKKIDQRWIEVIGAKEVYAYACADEMFKAFKNLRKQGKKVRFCTPDYQDRFTVEQIPTLGVFGA